MSYVTLSTRETFSKVGRELLGAIAAVHPEIISVLLDRVQDTIDQVGMVRALISFVSPFVIVVYFEPWSIGAVGKIVTGIQKKLLGWLSHGYNREKRAFTKSQALCLLGHSCCL